ncbi:MAG: hypothetical protein ABH851_01465 [Methanobacteriota archaeon]
MKTRVRYGKGQIRVRSQLDGVAEDTGEGTAFLDLEPEIAEQARRGADGSLDEIPTVYTKRRLAQESGYAARTLRDYTRMGKIPGSQNVAFGNQLYTVFARLPAERLITAHRAGVSMVKSEQLSSQVELCDLLGVDDTTMWSVAKRFKLPVKKRGKLNYFTPEATAVLTTYFTARKVMEKDYAPPEEIASRLGVTIRTVYNWLERDFEADPKTGVLLPTNVPAIRFPDGFPQRYLFPRELVEDEEKIREWRTRFPRSHKQMALPSDRRDWTYLTDLSEELGVKKQTLASFVKQKDLGEKPGKECIVSPEEELYLWRHYAGQRFANRHCLSIQQAAEISGLTYAALRYRVSRFSERDERGPRTYGRIRLFRHEGNVYFPKHSAKTGYSVETEDGLEAFRRLLDEPLDGDHGGPEGGGQPPQPPAPNAPAHQDDDAISKLMLVSRYSPEQVRQAIGTELPENRRIGLTLLKTFQNRQYNEGGIQKADDFITALMKLQSLNGRIPQPRPGEPRDRFLHLLARAPQEDSLHNTTAYSTLILEAKTPRDVARQLTILEEKMGGRPNKPTHYKKKP